MKNHEQFLVSHEKSIPIQKLSYLVGVLTEEGN